LWHEVRWLERLSLPLRVAVDVVDGAGDQPGAPVLAFLAQRKRLDGGRDLPGRQIPKLLVAETGDEPSFQELVPVPAFGGFPSASAAALGCEASAALPSASATTSCPAASMMSSTSSMVSPGWCCCSAAHSRTVISVAPVWSPR